MTFRIMIFLAVLFCTALSSYAATTYTVTSCTQTNVQNAVNGATNGDSIYLNCSGTNTWTSAVSITVGLTIYGQTCTYNASGLPTSCPTVINSNGTRLFQATLGSTADFRMHDLSFTGNGPGTGDWDSLITISGTSTDESKTGQGWNSLRIDHVMFTNIGWQGIILGPWYTMANHPPALFDHINFTTNTTSRAFRFEMHNSTWRDADNYGSANNTIYIEDSSFVWSSASSTNAGLTDTEHGVRFVVRYNTITNGGIQMHDTGSTEGARGNRILEVYGNTITCTSGNCDSIVGVALRGGSYMVYNNTISGFSSMPSYVLIQRATQMAGYIGTMCDGTAVRACNTPTFYHCSGGDHEACEYPGDSTCSGKGSCVIACTSNSDCPTGTDGTATCLGSVDKVDATYALSNGYPCRDQTGWGQEYGTGGRYQYPSPVYWWNNGTNATCASGGSCTNTVGVVGASAWLVEDRDYCYHSPATTCGYKSNWTYTALTYPHPLQSGDGDTIAPTVSSVAISANGTTLTVTWTETSGSVSRGGGWANSQINLDCSGSGANKSLTYVSGDAGLSWVFIIGTPAFSGETCNLDFDGGSTSIVDPSSNAVADFTNQAVTNNSTQTVPSIATTTFGGVTF